jgi:hypothetical protein
MLGIHGVKTVFVGYRPVVQLGRTRRGGIEYATCVNCIEFKVAPVVTSINFASFGNLGVSLNT